MICDLIIDRLGLDKFSTLQMCFASCACACAFGSSRLITHLECTSDSEKVTYVFVAFE